MERFSLVETSIRDSFTEAVREGLARRPRALPPRFFYDARGSELFDRICALPEYYVTRTELSILARHARDFPTAERVIEFGCGFGAKTRLLFDAFFRTRSQILFVPVDISRKALDEASRLLLADYPSLRISALQAEFDRAHELLPREPSLVLFLGSNIGNFDHADSVRFLSKLRGHELLVGFDMQKDPAVLHAAYNDSAGVTATFNLNILARINHELGGSFDLTQWEHLAFYNPRETRIEMHLLSKCAQRVAIASLHQTFDFDAGERIHTENSYKFSPGQIASIARESGFQIQKTWTDNRGWFSVVHLK